MLSVCWTFAGRTILNLTIGDDHEPDEVESQPQARPQFHTNPTSGYISEDEPAEAAFIQSPATVYLDGRPWPVKY